MSDKTVSNLLAVSFIAGPMALSAHPEERVAASTSDIKTPRPSARRMMHILAQPPILKPMGTFVGELQERWEFPSDHLPVGMAFDDFYVASWNVLETSSIHWVEENSQGLKDSLIAKENILIDGTDLTVRDKHTADLACDMLLHPTRPRSLLGLQECSDAFLMELKSRLPTHIEMIADKGNAVFIDRNLFEVVEAKAVTGVFSQSPNRSFQDITIRRLDNGELLRFINAHVPGDPNGPARYEFTQYLADTFNPEMPLIALGDMNFNEVEMASALRKAFIRGRIPYSLYSPYCTNISPYTFTSKAIDHFIVYNPDKALINVDSPEEVLPGLQKMADLLSGSSISSAVNF